MSCISGRREHVKGTAIGKVFCKDKVPGERILKWGWRSVEGPEQRVMKATLPILVFVLCARFKAR